MSNPQKKAPRSLGGLFLGTSAYYLQVPPSMRPGHFHLDPSFPSQGEDLREPSTRQDNHPTLPDHPLQPLHTDPELLYLAGAELTLLLDPAVFVSAVERGNFHLDHSLVLIAV